MPKVNRSAVVYFSVTERIGLTILVFLSVIFGIAALDAATNAATNPDQKLGWALTDAVTDPDQESIWVVAIFHQILDLVRLVPEVATLFTFFAFVVLLGATFYFARRHPLWVVNGLITLAALFVGPALLLLPIFILRSLPLAWELAYYDPRIYLGWGGSLAGVLLLPALCLMMVCFAGEFHRIASERIRRVELRVAEARSAADGLFASRRQRLVETVLGPRMPVTLALGRSITLIIFPALCMGWIGSVQNCVDGMEYTLPAPRLESLSTNGIPSDPIYLKINGDGQFFLNDTLVTEASDGNGHHLADILHAAKQFAGDHFLSLKVEPDTRHDRLVTLLNIASRVGIPVWLED